MSTVKTVKYQVGTDGTSTNNFTIYQPDPPDGTMRIGVGNADSPTEIAQFTSSGLNASALTGTLPAIDGSQLTGISSYSDSDALSLLMLVVLLLYMLVVHGYHLMAEHRQQQELFRVQVMFHQ